MKEIALAQITMNDGTDRKIFRLKSLDDTVSPNGYGWFGGELGNHPVLDQPENPISGMVRQLREQTSLRMTLGSEQLNFGVYSRHIVPPEYSPDDTRVKVHLFDAFIRDGVNYQSAFAGVDHLVATNKELLKGHDVVPMVRFILEQMAVERNYRLMNGGDI